MPNRKGQLVLATLLKSRSYLLSPFLEKLPVVPLFFFYSLPNMSSYNNGITIFMYVLVT